MSPQRIQRKRTKGWRMPDGAVYVGRPTGWGNPFVVGHEAQIEIYPLGNQSVGWGCAMPVTRSLAVDLFRAWLLARRFGVDEVREELSGRDLVCWCPLDQPCHADVLLEIANP